MGLTDDAAANRASLGGVGRSKKLTPEQRQEIARKAAKERWKKSEASIQTAGQDDYKPIVLEDNKQKPNSLPIARWPGVLTIGTSEIACYVLDDGRRVITRTAATAVLTDDRGGGH